MGKNRKQYHDLHHPMRPKAWKAKKEPIKITYISDPIMVKASNPYEFRAIVQELTGQNSAIHSPTHLNTTISIEGGSRVLVHRRETSTPHAKVTNDSWENGGDEFSLIEFGGDIFFWRDGSDMSLSEFQSTYDL